jgi:outer membrane protein OmpA-like peptidoglycan-associated protein
MSEDHQSYKCRICSDEIEVLHQECSHCGLTSGKFRRSKSNDDTTLHCSACDRMLKPLAPAEICNAGHRGECGWWDTKNQAWVEPNLSAINSGSKAVWISGSFQGIYTGELDPAGIRLPNEDQRSYTIDHFEIATLENVQKIDAPPARTATGEKPPILIDQIASVTVTYKEFDTSDAVRYSVTLQDFRLHEWREISGGEIAGFFGKASTGRVTGVAYAVLKNDPERPPKQRRAPTPRQTEPQPRQQAASSQPDAASKGHVEDLEPSRDAYSGNKSMAAGGQIPPSADTGSDTPFAANPPISECVACVWWVQLPLAVLVLYFCGWQHTLIFIAVAQVACWLAEVCANKDGIFTSITRRNLLIALIVLLATIGILIEAYSLAFSDDCALVSDWPIYLIATAFGLSALLRYCWLRLVLLSTWFLTLLLWCSANSVYCDRKENTNRFDSFLTEINIHVDTTVNPDVISDIVNDATIDPDNPNNNRKISIDEIVKDPELLDKCGNSIYFPEIALFAKGSPDIQPRAHTQLRKLVPLLEARNDKKIIITGHADKSGDETDIGYLNNIALSDKRAEAVANWLVESKAIDPTHIDIRGAGTSMPLTLDPERAEYNRRVEVQIECRNPNQRTKD